MGIRINTGITKSTSSTPVGATLMKTGQTTSYRTGDDGDLEAGRATDFFTLSTNNPFGNTNRFTDELGGSTYTNNIVIDWSIYDNVAGTVLGWDRRINGGNASVNKTWNDAIDEALAHTNGTFTNGWRLPNIREVQNILNYSLVSALNYSPFNITTSFTYWTSTTSASTTSSAFLYYTNVLFGLNYIIQQPKTSSNGYRWQAVRTFTVTGTTLT